MRYTQLGEATEAYADALDEGRFGLSFDMTDRPSLTVVIDRATLSRLQVQIASLLSPPPPTSARS